VFSEISQEGDGEVRAHRSGDGQIPKAERPSIKDPGEPRAHAGFSAFLGVDSPVAPKFARSSAEWHRI